jgi:ketosteroid isomerase-like protein
MRRKVVPKRHQVAAVIVALCFAPIIGLTAQTQSSDADKALFKTVEALDTDLFNAVNHCDIEKVDSYWAENALFLHDKDAPTVGRAAIVASIKNNVCGKFIRELVPGTLEVHALKDYGAVEIGVHRFLHPFAQDHGVIGEAKFIHVWQFKEGKWRITQVISYDHHEAK